LSLVDSHCHLDQFDDVAAVLQEAAACGVERVVAVSQGPESMRAVLELKRRFPRQILAGLGVHPVWATQHDDEIEAALHWLSQHLESADVLGEAGLDYKWAQTAAEQARQVDVLERQLALAIECGKPINLHSRRCLRQTMDKASQRAQCPVALVYRVEKTRAYLQRRGHLRIGGTNGAQARTDTRGRQGNSR
jgi:TatD DNase family protein